MKKFIFSFLCLFFVTGCASITETHLHNIRQSFANNNFTESAQNTDAKNLDNLELLVSGQAQFYNKQYSASDNTFEEFNRRNIDTIGGSALREAKSLIGGQLVNDYKPSMMDSLFVSYYQIWDAIGDNRRDDVRVIINQSYARQQEMSRAYADLVEKNQSRMTDKNSELMTKLNQQNSQWVAYTDIMNPALMYLSGIWFLNSGDFNDAETYLQRANGMALGNSFIETDLKLAEQKSKPQNTTWVFIESGFAPMLKQETLSLPIVTTKGPIVVSIAVPEPVFYNSKNSVRGAIPLADVNAMFMTEFNQYRINDSLRAWASAVARTIAQASAYNSGSRYSGLIGLGSTLLSVATTDAEIRSWVTLPESISVLRVKTPDLITSGLGDIIGNDISLPTSGNHLIYVRLTGNTPIVHIFKI